MLDIHTHLYWESYDADRDEVIRRAQEAGVRQMLVVGTTLEESRKAVLLAEKYENIFASVGIHPNEFREEVGEYHTALEELAQHPKVVAVGECGLDYSESHGLITPKQKKSQYEGLIDQMAMAQEYSLPLIIHCRTTNSLTDDAYRDLLTILQTQGSKLKAIILHCYMGDTEVTKDFLLLPNVYFSFTGNITYPVKKHIAGTKDDLTETVKLIPQEKIFVETDCPFLAPQKNRGERNEPAYVVYTADKICELQAITPASLTAQLQENYKRVF